MYEVLKVLHLIAVISWFAGLFYLPRLFVHHAEARERGEAPPELEAAFQRMERLLYKAIMVPAMVVALVTAIVLVGRMPNHYGWEPWLLTKIGLTTFLVAFHHSNGAYVRRFAKGPVARSGTWFRLYNEAPTLALIGIALAIVYKNALSFWVMGAWLGGLGALFALIVPWMASRRRQRRGGAPTELH